MGISGKPSKLSTIVAVLCITAYIGAIAFASVRIILNIRERQVFAEREFNDLAEMAASSSVFLGFMNETYQATIRDFLISSETLLGIIITGSSGEYAFERYPGSGIVWAGDSPRFKTGVGFPREPFFMPLGVEGQRNVTIQAIYGIFDYFLIQEVLKHTLLLILSTLIVAFLALLVEMTLKKRASYYQPLTLNKIPVVPGGHPESKVAAEPKISADKPHAPNSAEKGKEQSQRLYNPRGNIGLESYANDRLESELQRCVTFKQDLVLLVMELIGPEELNDSLFNQFTEEVASFFTMRDLIFGKGENGVSVIIPGIDLEQGIAKSEEFRTRIISKMSELFNTDKPELHGFDLCMGLSSRSGRLIEADPLMLEASSALKKTINDPASRVMAFKSDPDKYREFIKENH